MWSAIIVAALAAVQGPSASEPVPDARIVVEATGTVRTPPDVAELTYEVDGEGQSSDQAVKDLVAKSARVEDSLRAIDAGIDLHSNSVSVQAVRRGECRIDRYEETAHFSTGECAIVGYVATQDFAARTRRVSDAGTMVGVASRAGATGPKIESFGLADPRPPRRQAIAAALEDARAKAEALAAGSGARLGDLIAISLDGAGRNDLIFVTGSRITSRTVPDNPVTVSVTPSPVVTNAQVTVSYEILR
jgi:uncharacterized protein YggE